MTVVLLLQSVIKTNGLHIQWGQKPGYTKHITFPIAFSSGCMYFNFIAYRTSATENGWHYYNNLTRTDVYVMQNDETVLWIAIGY